MPMSAVLAQPGFTPVSHHPAAGELAGITGGVLRRWATPSDAH
jgi:hypothetical protein